ncbi:DUF938 domain-containing protein [Halomonas sp. MA07-2]|uniref:DUF938 domain-containing protein n=1 Tax=Halomonas sp. MA07-2 TaxID=3440841 RepID=UPI003EEF27A9
MTDSRLQSPAAARNRQPILEVLREVLPVSARVLEVASGSGEHALHCAAAMPGWIWQPSDPHSRALASITAWSEAVRLDNLRKPLRLDVTGEWPAERFDAVVAINLLHISPWTASEALMAGAAGCLGPEGVVVLYGPFRREGCHTAASNAAFDADLRRRDPQWGIRDLAEVEEEAQRYAFLLARVVPMPANNLILILRRQSD